VSEPTGGRPGGVPYRAEPDARAGELQAHYAALEPGAETGRVVTVAGRMMLRRDQGRLAFANLRDSSGSVQLFAGARWTADFEGFVKLSLGDWIAATGEVVRTRTGELSVKVTDWVLLAEARRSFGDKFRGITDADVRYRQRYADLWANEGSRRTLLLRSRLLSWVRRWLEERGFVEVETPIFHPTPGGAAARPFVTHHNALDTDMYLRIAPELYLKRLVVGGFERVFEIARVFRNEGLSPRHNPEFTMLELYQAYADYTDMMALVEGLVAGAATDLLGSSALIYEGRPLSLEAPWRRATMTELIAEHAGFEVDLATPPAELRRRAGSVGVEVDAGWGPGKLLLEIYEKTVEGELWGPIHVLDYPKEVSPLARDHRSRPGYVERFESIVAGRELCNAFSELTDPDEQRRRFEAQARAKAAGDDEAMPVDEDYLRALDYGLPPTGGIGIGVDRLVMLLSGAETIRDVIAFPTLRPEGGLSPGTAEPGGGADPGAGLRPEPAEPGDG
jgi:lysyl-tRNA synthetase class 2